MDRKYLISKVPTTLIFLQGLHPAKQVLIPITAAMKLEPQVVISQSRMEFFSSFYGRRWKKWEIIKKILLFLTVE
jgi:hypothetical protein